jgi:hypothetical protein
LWIFDGHAAGIRHDTGHANGAPPVVEGVEHIGLAEFNAHRTAARTLAVVALEVSIDARLGDLQRHTLGGPALYLLERRAGDPD